MEKNKVWKIIVNPHSGSGKTLPVWEQAQALLVQAEIPFEFVYTQSRNHAVELVKEAAEEGFRRFIAVGGDGTAHEVLNGMAYSAERLQLSLSEFTFAVIPIGSGNDWVKGHKVPHNLSVIVELLKQENFMWQDIVKITDCRSVSYMLNVGGVGFDAHVCRRVNHQKAAGKSGRALYVKSLIYNILNCRPLPIRLRADGKEIFRGPFYSIAFGLGRYSGGGMRQCPSAVMDDGLLDFTIIPRLPLWYLLSKIPRLFTGSLEKEKDLIFGRCRKLEVCVENFNGAAPAAAPNFETDAASAAAAPNFETGAAPTAANEEIMEADGEIVATTPFTLEVCSSSLRVLTNLK